MEALTSMVANMDSSKITLKEIAGQSAWAGMLKALPTSNTYTSWAWGDYKARAGWVPHRVGIFEESAGREIGCLQMQHRKLGPATVLLVQGGIHLRELSDVRYYNALQTVLQTYVTGRKLTLLILNHQAGGTQDAELALLRSGFTPVLSSESYTYVVDTPGGAKEGGTLSGNWRHNLKRAQKNEQLQVRWIDEPVQRSAAVARMEKMYMELTNRKAFAGAINFDFAREIIIQNEEFHIVEAWLNNEMIASRVGYFCNDHVLDFLAASGDAAKTTYANYLLLWKMIEMAREKGKSYFDCGGINPAKNMGVFNFKKGLGGRLALNGPIWLHGSSPMVKLGGRMLLSLKC